ncbi:uncharacterized protein TNCV_4376731 [Trichonephila clavipes]|nr:uncharacterized protein TNCV_4376731 [Trichonephila clavipes]
MFMQDGAPPHITRCVKDVLKHHFTEERVISRQFLHLRPPRSPDLNPGDFLALGPFKTDAMLAKNFKSIFLDEDSLVASYEWIRDLFQDTPEGLTTSEEEIFIDFTSSEKLKAIFVINHPLNFG